MTRAVRRPSGVALDALRWWLASRVAVAVTSLAALWMVAGDRAGSLPSWVSTWDRWDVGLFVKVAHYGYDGYPQHYSDHGVVAFFPGEPVALWIVHAVVRDWVVAGLLISAVAGAVACVALARVAELDHGADVGSRAVLFLVLSPYAVFLAAGYSEALFLALALPAWLAARRRQWLAAGILAALASTVRITGLFLALALVTQWALDRRSRRDPTAFALGLPFAALAGYVVYLHGVTGDWLAYSHAQERNWGRSFTAPWTALHTTWSAAGDPAQGAAYAWSFRAELAAVAVGVALCVLLALRRRWPELVYVGGQVAVLATSSYYLSVARTTLLWWPLWVMLAAAAARHRWLHVGYLAAAPALMAVGVVTFTSGHWLG